MRKPIDSLQQFGGWMTKVNKRLKTLETAPRLQNASISKGALRILSEEGLIVVGSAFVTGILRVVGRIVLEGLGILTVRGLIELEGRMRVDPGGEIVVGNVTIKDGKITVGVGGGQIIIDGATGKITAGNMVIDPTVSGGALTFANGAQIFTDGTTIQVFKGNGVMQVSDTETKIQVGGVAVRVQSGHIYVSGMDTKTLASTPGAFVNALVYDAGEMKRIV